MKTREPGQYMEMLHKYLAMVQDYLPIILPLVFYFLSRFVLLSLSLWILLRCQDLNYNIPGLLGSAALASAFDMIPIAGHPAAAGVLLFCVLKMTHSHIVDVRFTVAISYAVMFLMNMLLLSVMPEVKVNARTMSVARAMHMVPNDDAGEVAEGMKPESGPGAVPGTASKTNDVATAPTAAVSNPTSSTSTPPPSKEISPAAMASMAAANKVAIDIATKIKLKGVVKNARESSVMIGYAGKNFTLGLGESTTLDGPGGRVDVKVQEVQEASAVLKVGEILTPLQLK